MTRIPHAILGAALWAVATGLALGADGPTAGGKLVTERVGVSAIGRSQSFDATVQAVRQSVVASQVQAQIVALPIKAGDRVAAGRQCSRAGFAHRAATSGGRARVAVGLAGRAHRGHGRSRPDPAAGGQEFLSRAALDQSQARHSAALTKPRPPRAGRASARRLVCTGSGAVRRTHDRGHDRDRRNRAARTAADHAVRPVGAAGRGRRPRAAGRRVTAETRPVRCCRWPSGPDASCCRCA